MLIRRPYGILLQAFDLRDDSMTEVASIFVEIRVFRFSLAPY